MAQLAHRGLVGTLTLSNTKGVDVLVLNPATGKTFKVEAKTSRTYLVGDALFGKNYCWQMGKKHEDIKDDNLFYCFINLSDENTMPTFYIVPSKDVAKHVAETHKFWLSKPNHNDTKLRRFRIPPDDPKKYKGNWDVFRK